MTNYSLSVVLAGGGTAGHVNPLLATADGLRAADRDVRITVIGTAEGIESELVPARGYDLRTIARVPFPRTISPQALSFPRRFRKAVADVEKILTQVEADVVVGFGGYVATPAYRAARRRKVPIVVHEQNLRPGLANRLGAKYADVVATTFEDTPLPGAHHIGLPLQEKIAQLAQLRDEHADAELRRTAADRWGLDLSRDVIVVTGGSLGAQRINDAVAASVASLVDIADVVHLTGRGKQHEALAARAALDAQRAARYHVVEYTTQIDELFAVASVVVCRAGAGTVCELSALGIPAIYVPLPIGNGEQARNAQQVVAAGGARLVPDSELTAQRLVTEVRDMLSDRATLAAYAQRSRSTGMTQATERLVEFIVQAGSKQRT